MVRKKYSIFVMDDDFDVLWMLEVVLGYYYIDVYMEWYIVVLEEKFVLIFYDLIILDMNF